jgi:hypothetical protein
VLITILNLFKKVGARCCLFQAFCHPTSGKGGHAHRKQV